MYGLPNLKEKTIRFYIEKKGSLGNYKVLDRVIFQYESKLNSRFLRQ